MPRTCLACSSSERKEIDKALVVGEPLRNIAKRVSISPAGLLRHKSHVAGAIAKAQERREEKLGDSIFDEMRRLQRKALELLGKMESQGDYRGAVVAARSARVPDITQWPIGEGRKSFRRNQGNNRTHR
jgi:hypothetical protein